MAASSVVVLLNVVVLPWVREHIAGTRPGGSNQVLYTDRLGTLCLPSD